MINNNIVAGSLLAFFITLPDPRDPRGVRHPLPSLVVIMILAILCGANNSNAVYHYALGREEWLKSFLPLPHGIPSEDTFERVVQHINPKAWNEHFYRWTQSLVLDSEGDEVIALDGKTARSSHDAGSSPLHMVSAWSTRFGLTLAQEGVPEKSNEITVVPELIRMIAPAGAIITVDALNTQKDIAWEIREQRADYVLALKGNHQNLHDDVKWFFAYADGEDWDDIRHDYARTSEKAHGRAETRECWVTSDLASLDADSVKQWRDLKCIVRVRGTTTRNGETSVEDRYFLSSLPADAKRVMDAVRQHWGIENSLHWILDTSYAEDASKARIKNAQANWAAIRRLCISIFKQEKTVKASSNTKRLRAAIDQDYLLKLLQIKTT